MTDTLRALAKKWRDWLAEQNCVTASPFEAGAIHATAICADELEAALSAVPVEPATHQPTCDSWRCGWEWRTENGAGVCRQPPDSEIHYIGTVDSHQFVPRACNCGAAPVPAADAPL